jgi:hypothetical protein
MGLVFQANKGLIRTYPPETTKVRTVVIEPGKDEAEVTLAALDSKEAEALLLKLDALASDKVNPAIAAMVAEEAANIFVAVRMVKAESKASFAGILGVGANLDVKWLRPKDVGGPLLNRDGAAGKGLYGGASGGVFSWLQTFTANTPAALIPSQTMAEEAAVIHLGAIDPIEVPKLESIRFTLAGVATPAQSLLPLGFRKGFITDLPLVRFEKPIIVGPEKTQAVDVMPYISGDSNFQLLSLLIAKAEALTL